MGEGVRVRGSEDGMLGSGAKLYGTTRKQSDSIITSN